MIRLDNLTRDGLRVRVVNAQLLVLLMWQILWFIPGAVWSDRELGQSLQN